MTDSESVLEISEAVETVSDVIANLEKEKEKSEEILENVIGAFEESRHLNRIGKLETDLTECQNSMNLQAEAISALTLSMVEMKAQADLLTLQALESKAPLEEEGDQNPALEPELMLIPEAPEPEEIPAPEKIVKKKSRWI